MWNKRTSYLNIICKRGIAIRKKVEKQPFLYRRSGISIHSWLRSPSDVEVSKSNQESAPHTEYPMEHRSCCIYNDGIPCYRTSILVYTNIVFNYCERLRDTDLSWNLSWWYEQLFVKRTDFSLGCCFVSIISWNNIISRLRFTRTPVVVNNDVRVNNAMNIVVYGVALTFDPSSSHEFRPPWSTHNHEKPSPFNFM